MCLIAKKNSRKIADKDIRVYKIVRLCDEQPDVWSGPIYSENKFAFVERIDGNPEDESSMPSPMNNEDVMLTSGFFYSFESMTDAIRSFTSLTPKKPWPNGVSYKLCTATIPAGSTYYCSIRGVMDIGRSIASSSIIVDKPASEPSFAEAIKQDFIHLPSSLSCV